MECQATAEEGRLRIGELAAATSVTTKALRYYEAEGLLHEPARAPNGYRDYGEDTVARVTFIKEAQRAGLSLRQIGQVLAVRDDGRAPCSHVASSVTERLAEVDRRLRDLRATRRQLLELRDRVQALDPAACAPDSICSAVAANDR